MARESDSRPLEENLELRQVGTFVQLENGTIIVTEAPAPQSSKEEVP